MTSWSAFVIYNMFRRNLASSRSSEVHGARILFVPYQSLFLNCSTHVSYVCRRPTIVHMKTEKTEKCRNKCPTKVLKMIFSMKLEISWKCSVLQKCQKISCTLGMRAALQKKVPVLQKFPSLALIFVIFMVS